MSGRNADLCKKRTCTGIVLSAVGLLSAIGGLWFVRRHETALEDRAERALPGPPQ